MMLHPIYEEENIKASPTVVIPFGSETGATSRSKYSLTHGSRLPNPQVLGDQSVACLKGSSASGHLVFGFILGAGAGAGCLLQLLSQRLSFRHCQSQSYWVYWRWWWRWCSCWCCRLWYSRAGDGAAIAYIRSCTLSDVLLQFQILMQHPLDQEGFGPRLDMNRCSMIILWWGAKSPFLTMGHEDCRTVAATAGATAVLVGPPFLLSPPDTQQNPPAIGFRLGWRIPFLWFIDGLVVFFGSLSLLFHSLYKLVSFCS